MVDKRFEHAAPGVDLQVGTEEEEDLLFRGQMWLQNMVMGYWKQGLAIVCVILGVSFVYGTYQNHTRDTQRDIQGEIARAESKLPAIDPAARMGIVPMDDPTDVGRMAKLTSVAEDLETVAKSSNGAGQVMAWLSAAKTWQRADNSERSVAAYKSVLELQPVGLFAWDAVSALASLMAADGNIEGAAQKLRETADGSDSFIAQAALAELVQLYVDVKDIDKATAAVTDLDTRFPDSQLTLAAAMSVEEIKPVLVGTPKAVEPVNGGTENEAPTAAVAE